MKAKINNKKTVYSFKKLAEAITDPDFSSAIIFAQNGKVIKIELDKEYGIFSVYKPRYYYFDEDMFFPPEYISCPQRLIRYLKEYLNGEG